MSRNVTILIIVLVIVLIAGYLVWLRDKFQQPAEVIPSPTPQLMVSPTPESSPNPTATASASPSASPKASAKPATGSAKTN